MKIKLILDITKTQQAQLNAIVTGRQGDKASITVNVFIVDGGVPYNLTGNSVFYEGLKPNNAYVRDTAGVKMINATQGNFEYTFRPETFGVAGVGKRSYFSIEQGGTVRASTQDFGLVTIPDAATGNALSGPYIPELEELKRQAQALVDDINDRWVSVNDQLASLQIAVDTLDVVRRKGDTMTGNLKLPRVETTDQTPVIFNGNTSNRSWKWDLAGDNLSVTPTNNGAPGWDASKTIVFQNLLKKIGDTMSGNLHIELGTSMDRRVAWLKDDALLWGFTSNPTQLKFFNWKDNKQVFDYTAATNTLTVLSDTNLLKKTGDTMTGDINMSVGKSVNFTTSQAGKSYNLYVNQTNNNIYLYDNLGNTRVFGYDPNTKTFDVPVSTNLLKKTGDVMTGDLRYERAGLGRYTRWFNDNVQELALGTAVSGTFELYDFKNSISPMTYNPTTKKWLFPSQTEFEVAGSTNLLKKTGDTVQGNLIFNNSRELQWKKNDGTTVVGMALDGNNNWFAWNNPASRYAWKIDGATGAFTVYADNLLSKTGGEVAGTVAYTDIFPQVYKKAGKKSWAVHRPDTNSLVFVPELTPGTSTWDWAKQVELKDDGTVKQAYDTEWVKLPLQPNIVEIDGGCYGKRSGQTVTLSLNYKASSLVSDKVIQLPSTFVPQRELRRHLVTGTGKVTQLLISNDGVVYCSAYNDDIRETINYII